MSNFRKLTHAGPLGHGYQIHALCAPDGCYHVTLANRDDSPVYKLDAALTECVGESELPRDYVVAACEALDLTRGGAADGYRAVRHAELRSVRSAFDENCFCDLPVFLDDVAEHLAQMAEFNAFCVECRRRRQADPSLDAVYDTGRDAALPCPPHVPGMCLQLWCSRHAYAYRSIDPRVSPGSVSLSGDIFAPDAETTPGECDGQSDA